MVVGNFPISNKTAVVTGGGSGINLAFVRLALDATSQVLICDLQLTPEAESLVQSSSGHASFLKCDVSRWEDLEAIPAAVRNAFGPDAVADIWIAGAGVFEPPWSSFLHDTEADQYKTLAINAAHPIKLTRIAMQSLIRADRPGVVVNVSSMAGLTGAYGVPLYCASKHAVVGFTKSMADADAEENVKIVCVCPGMVSTPLWTGDHGKEASAQFKFTEDVCISAEEVAQAMKELIEDGETYPGGSLLEVSKTNRRKHLESKQSFDSKSPEMRSWVDHNYAPIRALWRSERQHL